LTPKPGQSTLGVEVVCMKKLFVAAALFLLAGCSDWGSTTGYFSFNQSFGPTFPVSEDGRAALYIVRDAASPEAPPINITMGGQPIGGLASRDYMRLNLLPKLYDLRAYGTQANKELIITVAPGQTRFLLAQTAPGDSAQLFELSQEQGRQLVRSGQLIWTPEID
jgi:hypothetical protein